MATSDRPETTAEDQPVDWLYLPRPVTHGLHSLGIETVGDLLLMGLRQVNHCQPLARLSQRDWVVLIRMLRRSLVVDPPLHEAAHVPSTGRSLAALGLPVSAARVLERYGVTDLSDFSAWTLGDLIGLRGIGASAVAAIITGLSGSLADTVHPDAAVGGGPASEPEPPARSGASRHRVRPGSRPHRPGPADE